MKQQVKRINLTGTDFNAINFTNVSGVYMVKNFSENDIYVSFDANATDDDSIKIPANFYQIVGSYETYSGAVVFKTKTLYVKGNGEVEVQQLCIQ